MVIKTKEKFIYLLLCSMVKDGYRVATMDLKKEILKRLSNRKYENIFYFFENLSNLNFASILAHLQDEGFIEVHTHENNKTTIRIKNRFFYPVCDEIIAEFNHELLSTMCAFLKEVNLSDRLTPSTYQTAECSYELTNPNKIYAINDNIRIVTDGHKTQLEDNLCLVENASFTIVETLVDDKLAKLEVHYRFDDERYIGNIIRQIVDEEHQKQQEKRYAEEFKRHMAKLQ